MNNNREWQDIFCGREDEFQFLKDKWKQVSNSEDPKPQVAILLAESGMGKTRLVQEFYGWLSENEDLDDYWPKKLAVTGENLRVNPEVHEFSDECTKMPYLWWGIRFSDPKGHNNQVVSHLSGYLDFLALHLQPLYQARFDLHRKTEAMKLLMGAFTLNVYEHVQTVIDTTHMLTDAIKQWRMGRNSSQGIKPKHKRTESVFTDIKDVLQQPSQSTLEKLGMSHADIINVPLVLWLDDAQWADKEMLSLLKALLKEAYENNWPLMVIATHWEREWAENKEETNKSFVKTLYEVLDESSIEAMIRPLGENKKLDEVLKKALPGLTVAQSKMFLDKSDANPRALYELIQFTRDNRGYFVGRNIQNALTEKAFNSLRLKELSFDAAINKRFASLPNEVKDFISLGSIQGTVFSDDISRAVLKNLWEIDCTNDVAIKSESPYAVTKKQSILSSEFRGRAFYLRAHEMMKLSDDDYAKAKQLTLQEIEQMTVDGRWMKLNIEDQQRLRSLYNDMTDNDYTPIYPEAKRTIEAEYAQDKSEMVYEDVFAIKETFVSPLKDDDWEDEVRSIANESMQEYVVDMLDEHELRDAMIDHGNETSSVPDGHSSPSEISEDMELEERLDAARIRSEEKRFAEQEEYYPGNVRIYIPSRAVNAIKEYEQRVELIDCEYEQYIGEWEMLGDYAVLCSYEQFSNSGTYDKIFHDAKIPFVLIHDYEIGIGMNLELIDWQVYRPENKNLGIERTDEVSNHEGLNNFEIRDRYSFSSDQTNDEILSLINHGIDFGLWNQLIDWESVRVRLAKIPEEDEIVNLCPAKVDSSSDNLTDEDDCPF